ncbi:uridine 5'-monophosphate synthase-like [Sarcoptes scabiei]|nr:uridine 5'-monophosphate synthase-like [Sarcoptes scabiei]
MHRSKAGFEFDKDHNSVIDRARNEILSFSPIKLVDLCDLMTYSKLKSLCLERKRCFIVQHRNLKVIVSEYTFFHSEQSLVILSFSTAKTDQKKKFDIEELL